MWSTRVLGLVQEAALVAWTLLAAWTVVPGGHRADAAWIAMLAIAGVAIAGLALGRARLGRRADPAPADAEAEARLPLRPVA